MHYRYGFLVPGMIIEGPVVAIIAGFLASQGYLNVWIAYSIAIFGDALGDSILYVLGRYGRRGIIARYGHWIGLHEARMIQLERHFTHHSIKTILLGKVAHGVGAAVIAAAGAAKMPYKKFMIVTLLVTVVKSLLFILVGFYFGKAYEAANSYLNIFEAAGMLLVVVGVLAYVIPRKLRRLFNAEAEKDL